MLKRILLLIIAIIGAVFLVDMAPWLGSAMNRPSHLVEILRAGWVMISTISVVIISIRGAISGIQISLAGVKNS